MSSVTGKWVISTLAKHGLSNGDDVVVRGTGFPAIDGRIFAVHVQSSHIFFLLYNSYYGDTSGVYPDSAYFPNPYNSRTMRGTIRKRLRQVYRDINLLHLEGMEVTGLVDGSVLPPVTVVDGSIDIPEGYIDLIVGLAYDTILEPIGINATDTGSALAQVQRIRDISVRFKDTLGAKTTTDTLTYHTIAEAGVESSGGTITWRDVVFRNSSDAISESPELFTGVMDIPIEQRHSKDPRVVLKQTAPMPFNVLGITYWFETTQNPEGSPNASSKTV